MSRADEIYCGRGDKIEISARLRDYAKQLEVEVERLRAVLKDVADHGGTGYGAHVCAEKARDALVLA